jgi:hypothetical protein
LTALAALGVALLYLLSVPIGSLSSLPASDASGATIVRFFSEHRGGVLVALALNGIAWCGLMPAAFAGLRALLGVRGGAAAAVALICAGVEAALIVVALVFGALAAYAAPNVGGELETVLADGLGIATNASAWPTVPCVIALVLAARRGGALPRPLLAFALLVAALHAVAAVSFARSGALSPSGVALAAPPAFAILMASIGVSLLRGTRARALERAPAEAAFPPSAGRS